MLVAIVHAADFEEAKQNMLEAERSFVEMLQNDARYLSYFQRTQLKNGLKEFDHDYELGLKDRVEQWTEAGFSPDEIEELTSVFRESQKKTKAVVEAVVNGTLD